jgi:hypothetical protein
MVKKRKLARRCNLRLQIELTDSPSKFTVDTNVLLTRGTFAVYSVRRRCGRTPPDWIREILQIPGVFEVCVVEDRFDIMMCPLADFRKIAPRALGIFLRRIDSKGERRDLSGRRTKGAKILRKRPSQPTERVRKIV